MKIHNVRLGLATNSSSTHSLIFLPPGTKAEDCPEARAGAFGWNYFTAASEPVKRQYLAYILFHSLRHMMSIDLARVITREWSGIMLERDGYGDVAGSIDHQSVYVLPAAWQEKEPDRLFFNDFKAFLLKENLVILGGNDNDGITHPLADKYGDFRLPLKQDSVFTTSMVCRKDTGGWWTVFNRETGAKIRFSFEDGREVKAEKASTPELVDIKITDFCQFSEGEQGNTCADFCYQGSTKAGKHASNLYGIIQWCGDNRVFEAAIGGGEPTSYPKIEDVLSNFRYYGVVPNMTTKNLTWLTKGGSQQNRKRDIMLEALGAFAYSAETGNDVENAVVACQAAGPNVVQKLHIQHVLGTQPEYELYQLISMCHQHNLTLTLLGYKTAGRGAAVKPHPHKRWLKTVFELKGRNALPYRFGIDTALAAESKAELEKAGVPNWCYATEEGKFSMYIDAVTGKFGPSSYCDPLRMKPFDIQKPGETLLTEFRKW